MWEFFSGEVTKPALSSLLRTVLDLPLQALAKAPAETEVLPQQTNQSGTQDSMLSRDLSFCGRNVKQSASQIRKLFWPLYVNYTGAKSANTAEAAAISTFRPAIDKRSAAMVSKCRPQTSMVRFLTQNRVR